METRADDQRLTLKTLSMELEQISSRRSFESVLQGIEQSQDQHVSNLLLRIFELRTQIFSILNDPPLSLRFWGLVTDMPGARPGTYVQDLSGYELLFRKSRAGAMIGLDEGLDLVLRFSDANGLASDILRRLRELS